MPPKRRTSTPVHRPAQQRSQGTISFGKGQTNRVTKASAQRQASKSKKDPALLDVEPVEATPDLAEPTTAEAAINQQAAETATTLDAATKEDPLTSNKTSKVEDVLGGRAPQSEAGAVGGLGAGWKGDEEVRAKKISEAQIKAYWRAKEQERKAPRVHQQGLTVGEKVLREWDMSGQYGPCIGIARLKRWKRANMLGLEPPIEVLAVLLRGMDQGDTGMQRAHVDQLMSSRFIET